MEVLVLRAWSLLLVTACTAEPPDEGDTDTPDSVAPPVIVLGRPLVLPQDPTSRDALRVVLRDGWEDADLDTLDVAWFADGGLVGSGATLPATATRRGQVIHVTVSSEGSSSVSSDPVHIRNAAPEVSLRLTPDAPTVSGSIVAQVESTDEDDDAVALTFRWVVDGLPVAATGPELLPGAYRRGSLVEAGVTATDELGAVREATASTRVLNATPAPLQAFLVPMTLRQGEELIQCVLPEEPTDPDGDRVDVRFVFRADGDLYTGPTLTTRIEGDTIPPERTGDGEVWTCHTILSDGVASTGEIAAVQEARPVASQYIRIATAPGALCRLDSGGRASCQGLSTDDRLALPPGNWRDLDVSEVGICAVDDVTEEVSCYGAPELRDVPDEAFDSVIVAGATAVGHATDGRLFQWGAPIAGSPVPSGVFAHVSATPVGGFCATKPAGELFCWGRVQPGIVIIAGGTRFVQAASTSGVVCGIVAPRGEVVCRRTSGTPLAFDDPPTGFGWVKVVAGDEHLCALKDDGTISCWGLTSEALEGPGLRAPYDDIDARGDTTCAMALDGLTRCWGPGVALERVPVRVPARDFVLAPDGRHCAQSAVFGWFCHFEDAPEFEGISTARTNAVALGLGTGVMCALEKGDITCLGDPDAPLLRDIPTGDGPYVDLALHDQSACVIDKLGRAHCWGDSEGLDDEPLGPFSDLELYDGRACGLRYDGVPVCWGGTFERLDQAPPPGLRLDSLAVGSFACGVQPDQPVACWGYPPVVAPPPPAGLAREVAVADGFACTLDPSGRIACWTVGREGPLDPPIERAERLRASGGTMCAIQFGGRVACWGDQVVR